MTSPYYQLQLKMLEDIAGFIQLSESVATAGQPTPEQFLAIKTSNYDVVVNLALSTSSNAIANECEIVEALGMQYVQIPVAWEAPQLADFECFLEAMKEHCDRKIFVHCAANKRVSAFMYLYRRICEIEERDRATEAEAQKDLHRIWVPNEVWQQFIEKTLNFYLKPN
ncbi:MAG: protein tyrosine phosphatase family protein [Cyanobacteriota bacterium]|nr:protein tyrosine phosphatase family protein [Cyanobacteriota bacterium]